MKTCPKCGSNKVRVFDSDNDICAECKEWFPSVEDISDELLIFIRPLEEPAATLLGKNVRISYGKYWVDFRDGKIKVTKESTGESISDPKNNKCNHIIIDARNEVIKSGYVCIKCLKTFEAGDHK